MLLSEILHVRRPAGRGAGAQRDVPLVRVRGGYHPAVVRVRAGAPIRIAFLREERAACSERVLFPSFGKSAMLPAGERVVVELPASRPGEYAFTCAMNMLRGTVVVE